MKKIINSIEWFFTNPRCLFFLGLIISLTATTIEVVRGRNTNYFDYQDSTRMFWEGITPYTVEFAQAHSLYFLYLPVFCVLYAPIFLLPWWLGPYVWNIGNFVLFSLAILMLPKPLAPHRTKIYLFLLSVLMLGGVLFRKHPFIWTSVSTMTAIFAITLIAGFIAKFVLPNHTHLHISLDVPRTVGNIVMAVLTVFNIWLSYRLFCRLQLVQHKWFNV